MTKYESGQVLMFAEPMEDGEKETRFIVIEDRDTRVLVEAICDLPFPPQTTLQKSDLVLAPEQDMKQVPRGPLFR